MFSTITLKNEKKPQQKSQEEHKMIFFPIQNVTCNKQERFFVGWFLGLFFLRKKTRASPHLQQCKP